MVTTTCYNTKQTWPSAKAAIAHFKEGVYSCDQGSSEQQRYLNIIDKLEMGYTDVDDSDDFNISDEEILQMMLQLKMQKQHESKQRKSPVKC